MKREIQLYDYQQEMKERIEQALTAHQSVMVQMPTGTGKTYLLAAVVETFLRQKPEDEVWIVAHRRELVSQIEEAVGRFLATVRPSVRVMSIQWLARHRGEAAGQPSLIVIDEAHHATAKTYKETMEAFPSAKKLGLTATPCRLRREGFTSLFDTLLQSWPMSRFIAEGRLSLYDYMSIRLESDDLRIVGSLSKRGADGDYSLREMSEKLDVRPSIERLRDTVLRFAKGRKGIVYAIDIHHAEHIAECYRRCGISAAAISCKTPEAERKQLTERFRAFSSACGSTEGEAVQVLVNVDLFGEGFDCPDVEFIQLARPTLSLAKYMQQVGRGMRVTAGKSHCLILDNVGLYHLFGLPSEERDWQAMFDGTRTGRGLMDTKSALAAEACSRNGSCALEETGDERTEMMVVVDHEGQRAALGTAYDYVVRRDASGLAGVARKSGEEVLPCVYGDVELLPDAFACLSSGEDGEQLSWVDLVNGITFRKRPHSVRHGLLTFSTADDARLYPRVRSRLLRSTDYVTEEGLSGGTDHGLRFRTYFIQPSEPDKLYCYRDMMDDSWLYEDEQGACAVRHGLELPLQPVLPEVWTEAKRRWQTEVDDFEWRRERAMERSHDFRNVGHVDGRGLKAANYSLPFDMVMVRHVKGGMAICRRPAGDKYAWQTVSTWAHVSATAYGILVTRDIHGIYRLTDDYGDSFPGFRKTFQLAELADGGFVHLVDDGEECWLNVASHAVCAHMPEVVDIDGWEFWKDGDLYYVKDERLWSSRPYRRGEIRTGKGICFVGKRHVLLDGHAHAYTIERRLADGCRFVVSHSASTVAASYLSELTYDGVHSPRLVRLMNNVSHR